MNKLSELDFGAERKVALLSIRPEYGEKLLTGEKTVELRRVRPRFSKGDLVILYASSPRKAIIGAFEVGGVVEAAPDSLWNDFGEYSSVSEVNFFAYFEGARSAVGILVKRVWRMPEMPLHELRISWPGFHPPQSFRYLTTDRGVSAVQLQFSDGSGIEVRLP